MGIYRKVIIVFFVLFFILGLKAQGKNGNNVEILVKAFQDTGAQHSTYWLHIGVPYKGYTNDEDLLKMGNNLSESFNLGRVKELQLIGNQKVYVANGTWGNNTKAELTLKRESDQSKNLYFIFRLKGTDDVENLTYYYDILQENLKKNQISPKINSCIQGNINGRLNNDQQFVLLENILTNLDANEVEKFDSSLVKSISAYSSKIGYYIWTGKEKMNIQVATHVDHLNEKTVLTMGTPIITIEY